jgi:hypothetical protein
MTGTLHEDQYTFFIRSRSYFLRMRNIPDKSFRENQNTHFTISNFLFENWIMWKNIVERGRSQMTIWLMRIACCTPKVTNTHSEYAMLTVFPLLQGLNKRAPVLHYTYVACIAKTIDIVTRSVPKAILPT